MPLLIVPFMTVTSISVQGFSSISSNASLSTTMSSTFSAQSYFESLVTILDVNGLVEVEGNYSNYTHAYDENAHRAVLCTRSLIQCACLLFLTHLVLLRSNKTIPMILSLIITNFTIKLFFACLQP